MRPSVRGTPGEVDDPVGMLAIEIAVRVDHLRLDPDAEVHAEGMHLVDEGLEAVGEFLRIDIPVAESGVVVFALAEPAVVHDEALGADGGGLLCEGDLAGLIDVHLGGFPGVVEDGADLGVAARCGTILASSKRCMRREASPMPCGVKPP